MLKISKKVVSVILVLCLMCSVFSVSAFAVSDNSVGNQGVQTGIGDDMNVKSTNSFGSLLTSELEQEADKQEENNGINIFSVEVTGKTASAEFETLQDSTLVVAIYDESGVEMLASGRTAVTKEDTTAEVTIDIETMPKYFYLKAFLVDEEVYRPLCTAYESPNYTKEMQEFFAKTTDDFENDKVLNLDNDKANNFVVYDNETKIIEPNGNKNQVASIDDESKKYVIKNADSSIISLKSGDIFSYNYGDDEILIVKVKSINVNGTTATIYGDEASMDEVFDYVKIDETSDLSEAEVDPSTCDEGVTYKGMNEEEVNPKSSSPVGAEFEGSAGTELDFDLCSYSSNNEDDTGYPQIDFKGSLKLGLEAQVKLYITLSQQYIELSLDYSASVDFSITEKFPIKNIQLAKIVIPIVPGLDIDVIPSFVIEANLELDLVGTLSGSVGIRANGNGEIENISKSPTFKTELKIQGTLFVGISMKPQLEIIWGLASAGLEASVGAEIEASMSRFDSDRYMTTEAVLHDCNKCIEGKIYGKLSLSAEAKFLYSDDLEISFNMLEFKRKICDFYYSFDHNSFGFTTCPYLKYKITVTVKDKNGKVVSNAKVNDIYTTNSVGKAEFYLTGGNYTITAKNNGLSASKKVSIDGESASVTIFLKKYVYDSDLNNGESDYDIDTETKSGTFNGSTYMYVDYADSWNSAKEWCERRGGHLATITSEEENSFLYNLLQSINVQNAYFGFTDEETEGVWKWVTGEESDYTNWSDGEPNNDWLSENYATFFYSCPDGTWNDGDFGNFTEGGSAFICEWDEIIDISNTDKNIRNRYAYSEPKITEPVSVGSDYKTEKFTNLLPNEVYNFYSMKTQNVENPFGSVNLLYITQATTDENGRLSVIYMPDESYDKAINFVVPLKQTDLSTAVVSMKGLIYNGKEQYVTPFVTLNGKTLVEGKDYDLSGDYFAKNAGSYTVTINGRGLYTGKVDFNYAVFTSVKTGDVNLDGTVSIDDVTLIQKYLASMVELDGEQLKAADVTGDGDVSIDDVTKIQKFLAGLVFSLQNA